MEMETPHLCWPEPPLTPDLSLLNDLSPLHIGHPPPKITWFKDGQSLVVGDPYEISPDGSFLWVSQANLSSAGHYSCIAANAAGEKTKHAQLNVLGECCTSPSHQQG